MSGVTVLVCGERGDKLTTPINLDTGDDRRAWVSELLPESDPTSPCWRFIDRYGDTYFNTLQLPTFIEELERLAEHATPQQHGKLIEIRALAEFASALPHRYLKFSGD